MVDCRCCALSGEQRVPLPPSASPAAALQPLRPPAVVLWRWHPGTHMLPHMLWPHAQQCLPASTALLLLRTDPFLPSGLELALDCARHPPTPIHLQPAVTRRPCRRCMLLCTLSLFFIVHTVCLHSAKSSLAACLRPVCLYWCTFCVAVPMLCCGRTNHAHKPLHCSWCDDTQSLLKLIVCQGAGWERLPWRATCALLSTNEIMHQHLRNSADPLSLHTA